MPISSTTAVLPELLSQQELWSISQQISRDFSPRLWQQQVENGCRPAQLSSHELLEISQQIRREFAPSINQQQSQLLLLAVSPRRLHVYWQVAQRRIMPLTLRIHQQPTDPIMVASSFDVTVDGLQGDQDVWLPEPLAAGGHYQAVLGEYDVAQSFAPILASNHAETPPLPVAIADFLTSSHVAEFTKTSSGQGLMI